MRSSRHSRAIPSAAAAELDELASRPVTPAPLGRRACPSSPVTHRWSQPLYFGGPTDELRAGNHRCARELPTGIRMAAPIGVTRSSRFATRAKDLTRFDAATRMVGTRARRTSSTARPLDRTLGSSMGISSSTPGPTSASALCGVPNRRLDPSAPEPKSAAGTSLEGEAAPPRRWQRSSGALRPLSIYVGHGEDAAA